MKTLHVFYDGGCGLCGKFRDHFSAEPSHVKLDFIPYQSARARGLVANLDSYNPAQEMVVCTNEGRVLQGVEAWLELLATMNRYRRLANALRISFIRPITRLMYQRIARNRRNLSHWLGLKNLTREEEACERCAW